MPVAEAFIRICPDLSLIRYTLQRLLELAAPPFTEIFAQASIGVQRMKRKSLLVTRYSVETRSTRRMRVGSVR